MHYTLKTMSLIHPFSIHPPCLQTSFLGATFPTPFMNSAGVHDTSRKDLEDLDHASFLSAIVSKSTTFYPRDGNPHPRYFDNDVLSTNSTGLANEGYLFYDDMANHVTKPYIVSVASVGPLEDMKQVVDHLAKNPKIFAIEINLSCPNVVGKPQPAYDFERLDHYLKVLTSDLDKPWGLKMPPYFDTTHFEAVATILKTHNPHYIACINSVPLGLVIDGDTETYAIKPNQGRGGLGGQVIKPIALSNVQTFRVLMGPELTIVGCGGIASGMDAYEHFLAGATMVQIGTTLMRDGVDEGSARIAKELEDILHAKGIKSLGDIVPLCYRD